MTDREPLRGRILELVLAGIFVAALLGVGVAYGVAVMKYKIFPNRILHEAQLAYDAWRNLGNEDYPPIVMSWEKGPPARPIRTLDAAAGKELILMTGGFYARLDLCPKFGCLAWVMDRSGKVLHTWPAPDPAVLFADAKGYSGSAKPINFYVTGLALAPDGALVTTFQRFNSFPYYVGVAKFDVGGKLLWKRFGSNHHWPELGADGRIYVPGATLGKQSYFANTAIPVHCKSGDLAYMEGVQVLSPDGALLHDFSAQSVIVEADLPGLLYSIKDGCDAYHVNGVDLVNAAAAPGLDANVGDLLVSLREASMLAVLDQDTGHIKHLIPGRTAAQHSPKFLPDGSILVLDNLGGDRRLGGSRVIRILPGQARSEVVYPRSAADALTPFYTENMGMLAPSARGDRVLVSSTKQGRVFELDVATGKPLWVYEHVIDFAPFIKARGLKRTETFARVKAMGAYYVNNSAFLQAAAQTADDLPSRQRP